MQSVSDDGELGLLFIDGAGSVRFIDRHALALAPYNTSELTVADVRARGTNVYQDSVPEYSKDQIVNDWRGQRDGGQSQTATDAASVTKYARRTQSITVLTTTDADVLGAIEWRLHQFKDPLQRIGAVTIMPTTNVALWKSLLGLEIGDRITLIEKPPGFAAQWQADYNIQGISVNVPSGPTATAQFTFTLWPVDTSEWFIFGTSTGKFGAGQLGY